MDAIIIALTATINKFATYVKRFTTRITTLKTERRDLVARMVQLEKNKQNLLERKDYVKSCLKKLDRNTRHYEESAGGLRELEKRLVKNSEKITKLQETLRINKREKDNAYKSRKTSKQHLSAARAKLETAQIETARINAEAEAQALIDAKAAQKTAKRAKNRAHYRAIKEEKRAARKSIETAKNTNRTVVEATGLSEKVLSLAKELGADLSNPTDLEAVLSLL